MGDPDLDAAEYVLGTLAVEERRLFSDRLPSDAGARAAVSAWEHRLAGLAESAASVVPPAQTWARIERRIAMATTPNPAAKSAMASDGPLPLRRALKRWRAAAVVAASLAAALVVALGIVLTRDARDEGASYVAAVEHGGANPALLVHVNLASGRVTVRPLAAETPSGKSLEVWYIGEGALPRSMGLVHEATTIVPFPGEGRADAGTVAVSVEPAGGSLTGAPTGPVVYSGRLFKE